MTGPARAARMPAKQRRSEIIEAATTCFAERGFAGTSTASVAALAVVNEALIFRHFGSKRALYIECVDEAWASMRARCSELFDDEPEAGHWRMPGRAFLELVRERPDVARMWMRGLVETTGTPEIDEHLAERMREVHAFVTDACRRSAAAGGLEADRDPSTEAWTIIAMGLLGASLGTRGLVEPAAFDAVLASHRTWLTGSSD